MGDRRLQLVYALLLLTGGLIGDLYGRRRGFIAGVALFLIGSLVCGLATDAGTLIAGRAIAGAGAALLLPCSLAILRVVRTDSVERGQAIGIWVSCNVNAVGQPQPLGQRFQELVTEVVTGRAPARHRPARSGAQIHARRRASAPTSRPGTARAGTRHAGTSQPHRPDPAIGWSTAPKDRNLKG